MKKAFSSILAVWVIATTLQVPVFKHTCHLFNKTEVAVLHEKACCIPGEGNTESSIDFKCCSVEKLNTEVSYETLIATNVDFQIIIPEYTNLSTFALEVEWNNTSIKIPENRPPPPKDYNRILLNKNQVLLI